MSRLTTYTRPFKYADTDESIELHVPVGAGTAAADVAVQVTQHTLPDGTAATALEVRVKAEVLVCGQLFAVCHQEGPWTLESGEVTVMLQKAKPEAWPVLVSDVKPGTTMMDVHSRFEIGLVLLDGVAGISANPPEGLQHLRIAAPSISQAYLMISRIYSNPVRAEACGVEASPERAFEFLELAAHSKEPSPATLFTLARVLMTGEGCEVDFARAEACLSLVAEQPFDPRAKPRQTPPPLAGDACYELALIYATTQQELAKGNLPSDSADAATVAKMQVKVLTRGANMNHPMCCYDLGFLVLEDDLRTAMTLFTVAQQLDPDLTIPQEALDRVKALKAQELAVQNKAERWQSALRLWNETGVYVALAAVAAVGIRAWFLRN